MPARKASTQRLRSNTRRVFLKRAIAASAAVSSPATLISSIYRRNEIPAMRVQVLSANVEFFDRFLSRPLQLSSGLITHVTEARVAVGVRVNGKEARGRSSMYLSDLWSWPDPAYSHSERDILLRKLCLQFARHLPSLCGNEPEHPLELGLRLHHSVCREAQPPILARIMCASPLDAAIHDATGHALGKSAFEFYSRRYPIPSADNYFSARGTCAAIDRVIGDPVKKFNAWWIVGAGDSLENDVAPSVRKGGHRCFKLKILGKDNVTDAQRTIEVFRAVKGMGIEHPRLAVDSNEANPDAASVLDYLKRLQSKDPEAFAALEYLEQPTARDIVRHTNDWRQVTSLKPVLLDEGLTHFELFEEAVKQGWSGFALKTCKGHSFSLVAAAWAHERQLLLSLQDLTNPGLAAIHAVLFAAHIPMINGVELNSPQFTPTANLEWLPRLSGLFQPRDGLHRLTFSVPNGLGSTL